MLVPIETLIDGLVRTLIEAVLPDVTSRFARGQLYAVVDVLRNLRDRVEPRAALLAAESAAAAAALERIVATLGDDAGRIAGAVAAAPSAPPTERAAALRAALVTALEVLDGLPAGRTERARAAIAEYLVGQTLRDLAVLKPSMLTEISKG